MAVSGKLKAPAALNPSTNWIRGWSGHFGEGENPLPPSWTRIADHPDPV